MKKSIAAILSLVMIASLCACSQGEMGLQDVTNSSVNIETEGLIPTIRSLDEYNAWVTDCTWVPDNFIEYSDLEDYGEFSSFSYFTTKDESNNIHLKTGIHRLIDANGVRFTIRVRYITKGILYGETLDHDETATDMLTHPTEIYGTVYRGRIKYIYNEPSELRAIIVTIEGLDIQILADFKEYTISDKSTILDRLLSADIAVASAVAEELAAKLAQ